MPPRKQPWFRFYTEAIWDRKLRRLPASTRWLWVTVLACAKSSPEPGLLLLTEGDPMEVDDLIDAAALSRKEVVSGLETLARIGLIDRDANTCSLFVVRWKERQFESDDVSLRTAKHRSKERSNNGDATPQIQKTDTDSEVTPLPPTSGGRRAEGTNPRAVAAQRATDEILDKINACPECSENPNVWCDRCTGLRRKLSELSA